MFVTAPPALAHALDGAAPTNYRTRILSVEPDTPGLEVKVVEAGNRLELANTTGTDAVVMGYKREPYLRVGPDGVFENIRSPATYLNRERLPAEQAPAIADAEAEPEWEKISNGNQARWHDHRVHYMGIRPPGPVRADPGTERVILPSWEVPIRLGDSEVVVQGDLTWVPGPSRLPWLALAAGAALAVAGLVLGPFRDRRRPAHAVMLVALAGLVVLDVARLAGLASDVDSSFFRAASQNLPAVAAWLLAAGASVGLLRGDTRIAPALAAGAGVLFALGALGDLDVLNKSQVPTDAPVWVARLAVAAGLGAGAGLLAGVFGSFVRPLAQAPAPASAGGTGREPVG